MKKGLTLLSLIGLIVTIISGCSSPTGFTIDVKNFTLISTMFTTIDENGNSAISTNLLWPTLAGISYYKLTRKTDDQSETTIGPSQIPNTGTSFEDKDGLVETSSYTYVIKVYDKNDKVIDGTQRETAALKPLSAKDLPPVASIIPPEDGKITDEITFSWRPSEGANLYYAQLKDPKTNELRFGVYTDAQTTSISVGARKSPVSDLPATLLKKLPIETRKGIQQYSSYKFSVIAIKTDSDNVIVSNAIGLRYSDPITVTWQ